MIEIATGEITNLIMASPDDPAEQGFMLVADPPSHVEIGMIWTGAWPDPPEPPRQPPPQTVDGLDML